MSGYLGYTSSPMTNPYLQPNCCVLEVTKKNVTAFTPNEFRPAVGDYVAFAEVDNEIQPVESFSELESAFEYCKEQYGATSFITY